IADAFVREASASMDYASRGKYFRKILARGLPGSFRHSATVIN
ncbi:MAG: methyl-accepting chemotaxis protein, partial [Rhodocyclaceae bacterium]